VSRKVAWTLLAVLLVAVYAGYRIANHLGPNERGAHDLNVQADVSPTRADAPHVGACPLFPSDNIWNTPIDTLSVEHRNNDYIASIGPQRGIHPDFGANLNTGIPYTELTIAGARGVRVDFSYIEESDTGLYPVPHDAPIEGGAEGTNDRHVIVVDPRTCVLYELFSAFPQADGSWKAGSGIKMDLTSNALRRADWTSADAAGLPILPGLVRYDEVAAGAINHALRFTIPVTQSTYVWPARHKASKNGDLTVPPMGARFRLRADFDVSKYSKTNQVILKCLQKYGMILADNGSSMFVSGVADKRWDDSDLKKLGEVKAEDFEAIDESDLQLLPDSGRVNPLKVKK
jgi:hypothetical protein